MNSPSAAHRWTSYRYAGRYGTIMIGAIVLDSHGNRG